METESGERKQVRVTILNQSFTLVTQGDPNEMIDLANHVDDLMNTIARKSPNLDSTRVAVFACLQLADQLRSRAAEMDSRVRQLGSLLDDALGAEDAALPE
ncbi:MAG: cell division protein ZapA [Bryobacteraceae bacterium]